MTTTPHTKTQKIPSPLKTAGSSKDNVPGGPGGGVGGSDGGGSDGEVLKDDAVVDVPDKLGRVARLVDLVVVVVVVVVVV